MPSLFDPLHVGDIPLANRVVMAPLTRNRAIDGCRPGPLTVDYYRQRATAGLIIAEASQISPMAQGYLASSSSSGTSAAFRMFPCCRAAPRRYRPRRVRRAPGPSPATASFRFHRRAPWATTKSRA